MTASILKFFYPCVSLCTAQLVAYRVSICHFHLICLLVAACPSIQDECAQRAHSKNTWCKVVAVFLANNNRKQYRGTLLLDISMNHGKRYLRNVTTDTAMIELKD